MLFDFSLPGRAKKTLASMNTKNSFVWTPPHPLLQCWWFLSVLSVQKKRSFMFCRIDDAYDCNIEVGGLGDAIRKRLTYAASVFFARPGVKRMFSKMLTTFLEF